MASPGNLVGILMYRYDKTGKASECSERTDESSARVSSQVS